MTTIQRKKNFRRGMVVLVLFPNSDLTSSKTRPAVIVQADNLNTGLSQVVVAMVTSQMKRAGYPSRVEIKLKTETRKQSGLLTESVIMTDNLATISLSVVHRAIGVVPLQAINIALRHTLDLS